MSGWIGVDLDGVIALWGDGHNTNVFDIGPPVPAMIARVKAMLAEGKDVRIFTARVAPDASGDPEALKQSEAFVSGQRAIIEAWCFEHLGRTLPITCVKDFRMETCYDDRAVQMVPNTGLTILEHALQPRDYGFDPRHGDHL